MSNATGIDVSVHQVSMDWDKAKSQGIVFAACRATVGDYYTDPHFPNNWKEMKRVGLWRTAYHVVRPDNDSSAQMTNFFNIVGTDTPDLPWVLDLEVAHKTKWNDITKKYEVIRTFTPQEINSRTLQCARIIEQRTGRKPLMYTNYNHVASFMKSPSFLADYDLWVASYPNDYTYSLTKPTMPPVWDAWVIWQYEADGNGKGNQYGAGSPAIDLDRFNGTVDEMRAYFNIQDEGQSHTTLPPNTVATWPDDTLPHYHETIYQPVNFVDVIDIHGHTSKAKISVSGTSHVACHYRPALPSKGQYMIEAFIPAQHANAHQVTYHIETYINNQRGEVRIVLDQGNFSNQWIPLGVYELDPGREDDGRVNITDHSPEQPPQMIAFSGIRWRQIG